MMPLLTMIRRVERSRASGRGKRRRNGRWSNPLSFFSLLFEPAIFAMILNAIPTCQLNSYKGVLGIVVAPKVVTRSSSRQDGDEMTILNHPPFD